MEIERDAPALDQRQHSLQQKPFVVPYQFSESTFCRVRNCCAANFIGHKPSKEKPFALDGRRNMRSTAHAGNILRSQGNERFMA
jgi:hypothetical protein